MNMNEKKLLAVVKGEDREYRPIFNIRSIVGRPLFSVMFFVKPTEDEMRTAEAAVKTYNGVISVHS